MWYAPGNFHCIVKVSQVETGQVYAHLGDVWGSGWQLQLVSQQEHIGDRKQRTGPVLVLQGHRYFSAKEVDALELVGGHNRHGSYAVGEPPLSLQGLTKQQSV